MADKRPARSFTPAAPDPLWTGDIAYIHTGEGRSHLATVLDLFSREIDSWSLKPCMTANVVTDALSMAWFRRNLGDDVIFHSNRGWQHDKQAMAAKVTEFGEAASVSRKCHCWDNASSESFLDSLKNERVHGATHAMRADAQANLFDHIEVFYKRSRRHSAPGYGSPPYPENWIGQRVDRHGETT